MQLAERVFEVLDRRLRRDADAPLAVALSGGGDSLALALLAAEWAKDNDRRLLILTVDHGLRRESAAWTEACQATAQRLGADFQALRWDGAKPVTGLAAAARAARHRMLADAARRAGGRAILMGHTGSDVLEAEAMRAAGSTTPDPKEWAPSPAWPEGRGVFLLRPMLGLSRRAVRDWLAARGERWIEDPANADPGSARVRARALTAEREPVLDERDVVPATVFPQAEAAAVDAAGGVVLPRRYFLEDRAEGFLGVAAVCAGGGDQRPASEKLARLAGLLRGPERVTASLAGARIEADDETVGIFREAGEARRGGMTQLYLTPGQEVVWDGRYVLSADRPGLYVQRLEGLARRLAPEVRAAVLELPAAARGALPAVVGEGGVECPVLGAVAGVSASCLVGPRLWAACGQVEREPA